jgi:5-(hydroxymethyl)furfural/furfural oxidase
VSEPTYDFIVVGGGTAGSVLANRLSADGRRQVLLIEAGIDTTEASTPPEILDGLQPWLPRFAGERFFWPGFNIWRAAEHPGIERQPQFYEQGRILGGGSSVNMVVSNRGVPADYDEWARRGAFGWDWQGVLPFFRKLENDAEFGADTELHGSDGPLPIRRVNISQWTKFTRSATAALETLGLRNIADQNGRFEDGYFPPTFSVVDGKRVSAARAYLDDAVRARTNLSVWTEAQVLRLVAQDKRITGVEVRRGEQTIAVSAGEIILAAGALQSPALLLRAGIGPADQLRDLGIAVLADRAGVGQNLWDHSSIATVAPISAAAAADAHVEGGALPHQLGVRLSSGVDPQTPADLFLGVNASPITGTASAVFWINKPNSSGRLRLRDADPFSFPEVDFNLLSDARDLARLQAGLKIIDQLFKQPTLAQYGLELALSRFAQPQTGGPLLKDLLADTTALEDYLRRNVSGVWHASGTCRIGAADDAQAVVDASGRVYGVQGLRVADASIMPVVPAANTNLPTVMIAEKLADAILKNS